MRERHELYARCAGLGDGRPAMEPRDLLDLVPAAEPIPLEEVEPVDSIVRRFSGGAMPHGGPSAEAHETIAIALNRLGGRSNSGEGGEDPTRYRDERNSKIKQVASGRFVVTAEYAASAEELQIKVAQGSKPGEGGQIPAHKVTEEIARLRGTSPGVSVSSAASDVTRRLAPLAAAAPRHLLDRGPRPARLRPPRGEPRRGHLGQAG